MSITVEWKDYTGNDSKALVACFFLVPFTCWVLQEILERKCGMEPQIYVANSLKKLAERIEYHHQQSQSFGGPAVGVEDRDPKGSPVAGSNAEEVKGASHSPHMKIQTSHSTSSQTQMTTVQILASKASLPSPSPYYHIDGTPVTGPAGSTIVDSTAPAIPASTRPPRTSGTSGTSGTPNWKRSQLSDDSHSMPMRLTKSADKEGRYRMTVRSSVYAIKAFMFLVLLLYSIVAYFVFPGFYKSLFWDLDAKTFEFVPLRVSFAYVMAFYLWELAANRYGKISWSVIAHHVVVCLVVCEVLLLDVFLPFIVMYGIFGVGTTFGLYATLSLRATKWASKHADLIRRLSTASYWSYLMSNMIINVSGNLFLVINGAITGNIAIFSLFTISISIAIWLYDDFKLLAVLKEFAEQHYETAAMLQVKAMVSTDDDLFKGNTLRLDTELAAHFGDI